MSTCIRGFEVRFVLVDELDGECLPKEPNCELHTGELIAWIHLEEPHLSRLLEERPDLIREMRPRALPEVLHCGADFCRAAVELCDAVFAHALYLGTATDELRRQEDELALTAAGATARVTFGARPFDRWPPIRGPPRPSLER